MENKEYTTQVGNGVGEKGSVQVIINPPEESSRLLAISTLLFMIPKLVLLIPHLIVLYFLGIIAFFIVIFGQIVVLITGKYPSNLHKFVVGVLRWKTRVSVYMLGLRDEYPPFTLE